MKLHSCQNVFGILDAVLLGAQQRWHGHELPSASSSLWFYGSKTKPAQSNEALSNQTTEVDFPRLVKQQLNSVRFDGDAVRPVAAWAVVDAWTKGTSRQGQAGIMP